jgi:hypothetical protein
MQRSAVRGPVVDVAAPTDKSFGNKFFPATKFFCKPFSETDFINVKPATLIGVVGPVSVLAQYAADMFPCAMFFA